MTSDVHITPEGLEAVRNELHELTTVKRPAIVAIVKNHVLIKTTKGSGVVAMGSTVRFEEDGEGQETYRIVGPAEADPKAGRVSYESALGKALIGHRVGDEVEIKTPNGAYRVRIVGVD